MDTPLAPPGSLARPVRVEPNLRTIRVAVIVPCFNRPGDLALLAGDLAACVLQAHVGTRYVRIDLSVLVIDNASAPPLHQPRLPHAIPTRLVRLAVNTGGSGGYNAGMALALTEGESPDYLWLVDSDARVEPDTLATLLAAMEADPSLVVAGPAIADTETGRIHEIGGRLDRRTGRFGPAATEAHCDDPIECDYVAACCALVRAEVVRKTGLMPDTFLNADDVEWCIRLAQSTGGRVAAIPAARAAHPCFDRFASLPRYFGARNAFGPIDALGLGRAVRFRRAMRETFRAVNQILMARPDLAALHIRGLRDAARGISRGLPADLPRTAPARPLGDFRSVLEQLAARDLLLDLPRELPAADRDRVLDACHHSRGSSPALEDSILGNGRSPRAHDLPPLPHVTRAPTRSIAAFLRRAVAGPRFDVAIVPAKGSPAHWLVARHIVAISAGGVDVRRVRRAPALARSVAAIGLGSFYALRIAASRAASRPLPLPGDVRAIAPLSRPAGPLSLSVVILSYNRREAILQTLRRLRLLPAMRKAETIVIDNASTDGSPDLIRELAPWARLTALQANVAIAGFNRGVDLASGELVLILDDDARPDPDALSQAIALLAARPELGAVTLLPVHPATGRSEWPFAEKLTAPRDDWPVMGCCNLVRRSVWRAVGGYESSFFLYRNDADLALKILAAGRGVHFNPEWRCEHDSPAAASKSPRWCRLATRNWIWLARRHGRGATAIAGAALGWLWAHKLSGFSPSRHWNTLRGAIEGAARQPAPLPPAVRPGGRDFSRLLRLRFGTRNRPQTARD